MFATGGLDEPRDAVRQVDLDVGEPQKVLSEDAIHAVGGKAITVDEQIDPMQRLLADREVLDGRLFRACLAADTLDPQALGGKSHVQPGTTGGFGGDEAEE